MNMDPGAQDPWKPPITLRATPWVNLTSPITNTPGEPATGVTIALATGKAVTGNGSVESALFNCFPGSDGGGTRDNEPLGGVSVVLGLWARFEVLPSRGGGSPSGTWLNDHSEPGAAGGSAPA